MIPALASYVIKEHVGVFKMTGTYDIFNPETNEQIAVAQEKKGFLNILCGFFMNKRMLPTRIDVHEGADHGQAALGRHLVRRQPLADETAGLQP